MTLAIERNQTAGSVRHKRGWRADVPPGQRAKRSNNPLSPHDLTSPRGRRIADLFRSFSAALDNPPDLARQAHIAAAAELITLAEEVRLAAIQDPANADIDAIIRLENAADRAVRRLGIRPGASAPKTQTLADILDEHRRNEGAK